MEACEQIQKGPLKLKGVAELSMTKQKKKKDKDEAKRLESMGMSIKNKEKRCGLEMWTSAQVALEEMQQMERILKKASQTHKPRAEDSTETWTHSQSTVTCPESAGKSSFPAPGYGVARKGSRRQSWGYVWCLWYFPETFFYTHPCVFC
uniref:Protein FAM32A n=1 Tax=Monodon monoceros TaxID=40151 RepID=A0A8C6ALM7_MONMO